MSMGPNDPTGVAGLHDAARRSIGEAMATLQVAPPATDPYARRRGVNPPTPPATDPYARRRGGETTILPDPAAPVRRMILVDRGDGAMEWRDPEPTTASGMPRRSVVENLASGGQPVADITVEKLEPNRIVEKLESWDVSLTPNQGLRRWTPDGRLEPIAAVPDLGTNPDGSPGRALLIIHGTFSNSENIFEQLGDAEDDAHFLAWAAERYRQVLTFDHPTLSVSPILNAMDLARLFAGVRNPVDVICHSRGGLVARWWLEAFGGAGVGERRVVFVASPLGGTSLASPVRARAVLNLFTTVGAHLRDAGAAASVFMPFTTIALGLMQVFVSITGAVANSPLADLFFNAVPGLGAMSRVGNNTELARLQSGSLSIPSYFGIFSDFQMERAGWRFWKYFQDPGLRAASWGASLIFEQANDLVVDNRSTYELFKGKGIHPNRLLNLTTNGKIFHTNYFQQVGVLRKIPEFLA